MVFSSIIFIFYFLPLFFLIYYLADKKYKNGIILTGSILFYAWGAPKFIFVILGTTIIDFYVVRMMAAANKNSKRKLLLCTSLCINFGLLFYFKYCNFFIDNLNYVLNCFGSKPILLAEIILPIGISFFTFETITYVADVYKGIAKPVRHFWDYQLYIILFPKLIAGPIIAYHDFEGQIEDHTEHETSENKLRGLYRFCIGLGKKVMIANVMGVASDHIFGLPAGELDTTTAWFGAISYTFQIYFDFSGYSDMALGLGQMMGFRFPENFNNPYTALSVTEFWRRWHISLSTWLYTYVFTPLSISLRNYGILTVVISCITTFFISGLWHGAAWHFIAWGLLHGIAITYEALTRKTRKKIFKKIPPVIGNTIGLLCTFSFVCCSYVFFRAKDINYSLHYLGHMFSWHPDADRWRPSTEYFAFLAIAIFFSFFTLPRLGARIQQKVFYGDYSMSMHYLMAFVVILLFIISAGRITSSNFNSFIYFRF